VVDAPVHGVDVAPTMLAAFGIRSSQARDGLDLAPLWRGVELPPRDLFAEADQDNRHPERVDLKHMVRRGAHKLVFDRAAASAELYDLARDPLERADRAREQAELTRELALALRAHAAAAVEPERIPEPSAEERERLEALGYGGGGDEADGD
jgi:arylsulfatase A-like enzyme